MAKAKRATKRHDLILPILVFAFLTFAFFWKFFLKGLLPFPADITVGLYFPWLDYKWGFSVGVPVKNPLPSDIPSLVYPWRIFVIEQLREGALPLWNPFYFGGMPLLANFQSAVFSWVNVFFLFLPQVYAWSVGILIQPFLTGLFTFLFLRHLKISRSASVLGGIVFAFSGFSLMWLEYNVHGHAAMWLPILLLITDKIIQKKNWTWALMGGLVLAIQIFAGYPQVVLYSLTAVGFYSLFRLFLFWKKEGSWRLLIRPLFYLLFFIILGVLLAAVQILPGAEALKLSVRRIDPIAEQSSGGFLPWQSLVTFLAPDFFGNPATYNFWGRPWYDNFALYVGVLPLILAFLAIFLRRDKLSWFFTSLAFFALVIALPTPIGKIISKSGLYGVKAISARIIFLLDFSLAILAVLGLDWLVTYYDTAPYRSGKWKGVLKCLAVFFLFLAGLWGFVLTANRFFPEAEWLVNLAVAKRNLILPTALFFASALILTTPFLFKRARRHLGGGRMDSSEVGISLLISTAIILLATFDLFRFGWKYLPFTRSDLVFPTTPVIEFLEKQERPFRVEFGEAIPQNMWMPYGLESAAGYDAMAPLRYSQFLGALRTGRADNPYGRVGQVENYESPLFNLANVKYLLAVKYDEKGIRGPEGEPRPIFNYPKFKLVFEDKTTQVYENLEVLPRAFWVHDYEVAGGDQEVIDKLLLPDFEPGKKIILEENPNFSAPDDLAKQEGVEWLEYQPQKITLRVFSDQPGFVFLANNFYSGWRAFVDQEERKIYRADFTFQALKVPAGEHQLKLIYDPTTFRQGLFISLGTLIIILGITGIVFFTNILPRAVLKVAQIFNR